MPRLPMPRSRLPRGLAFVLLVMACNADSPSDERHVAAASRDASPTSSATPSADSPAALRVGFWNVRRLGLERNKDVATLCAIIAAHFDVVGLAEVMADDAEGDLPALRDCLAPAFDMQQTTTPKPYAGHPYAEHSVAFYRRQRVQSCPGYVGLRYAPENAAGPSPFLRPPAFGCFETEDGASRFLLGVYHARWGTGDAAEITVEVAHIGDVLPRLCELWSDSSNVLLFGDFNLTPADLMRATSLTSHTLGSGSTLSPSGEITAHLYDQLLVAPGTDLRFEDAEVGDVRDEAGGPAAFHAHVSDHLPIVAIVSER